MLLACIAFLPVAAAAQDELPQINPGERKAPRKKEAGPRAVAILQMTASGKTTLVPIAILVYGKFWDASAYKANPIPMSLEPGTVYEAERTGSSLGLFTVSSALHSDAVNAQNPWLGTGRWVPAGAEKEKKEFKADAVPVGIDNSDAPPRLTRDPTKMAPASPTPSSAPQATPSDSGDGPPRLTKHDAPSSSTPGSTPAGQSPSGSGSPTTSTPGNSKPGDTKPADSKTADAKSAQPKAPAVPPPPPSDSGADEASRPKLRRGKPVDPLPEDEVPGYSKPGAVGSAAAAANGAKAAEVVATKEPVQLIPAISDATGPIPRSFAFEWLKGEEGDRREQMNALAKEQVRAYVAARAKASIVAMPAGPHATAHPAAHTASHPTTAKARGKDPILENVQMTAYDLWTTNQPVLVLTADAHMPPRPPGAPHADADSDLQYSIMLVAYPDIYNNLHKIYAGVTDKYHLDMTPRLELVDAVDADGDGRGELLFRETSDAGSGWVIYRATADKLWKMFDSLHPE